MSGPAQVPDPGSRDGRRFPRYSLDSHITVHVFRSGTTTSTWGRSTELSEDGVSGTLTGELTLGDVVSLELTLPLATDPLKCRAVVRHRDSYHYGFEFLTLNDAQREAIKRACDILSREK